MHEDGTVICRDHYNPCRGTPCPSPLSTWCDDLQMFDALQTIEKHKWRCYAKHRNEDGSAVSKEEQITNAKIYKEYLQPELNQITEMIINILKRCPDEYRDKAQTLLTSDLVWYVNEADFNYEDKEI